MKSQQIFAAVLILSVCQCVVLGKGVEPDPTTTIPTTVPEKSDADNTTTTSTTSTTPASTTTTPTTPTTTTTTTTPTTSTSTTTTSTTSTSTTPAPTTSTTPSTTTTTAAPTPAPSCRHFDAPSFFGGIVLTIGLIAIGFVAHKIYKSKFDRNYHTL